MPRTVDTIARMYGKADMYVDVWAGDQGGVLLQGAAMYPPIILDAEGVAALKTALDNALAMSAHRERAGK